MTEQPGCASVRDLIPELAAGGLAGDERAGALRHLAGCAGCSRLLDEYAIAVDELLALPPSLEPPARFTTSVLARIEAEAPRRRRVLVTGIKLVLTAVVAGTMAGGLVWQSTAPDRDLAAGYRDTLRVADGSYLAAGVIYSGRRVVGHVFAYQGSPSWVFLTVVSARDDGRYRVTSVADDGDEVYLGQVSVADGRGSWGTAISGSVRDVARLRLHREGSAEMIARLRASSGSSGD